MVDGQNGLWSAYVGKLAKGEKQRQIGERAGVDQTTAGRWLAGTKVPTNAANVAAFCQSFKRNPLEGFVAAGMLSLEEAGKGLNAKERMFLLSLSDPSDTIDAAEAQAALDADQPAGTSEDDDN